MDMIRKNSAYMRRTRRAAVAVLAAAGIATAAQAAKPSLDCSKIRGACYSIKDAETVKRELGYGARVGLNTVRVWLSPRTFEKRGDEYVREVVDFVRTCHSCGYKTMPILFNGNMLDPETIRPGGYDNADRFTKAIVPALKNEPGLLMFDMMNEPLCNGFINRAPVAERSARAEEIWSFLRRETDLAVSLAPDCLFTIGYTVGSEIEETTASRLDVISFHDYSPTRAIARDNYAKAAEWGRKLGKPVLQTETGCLARANSYEMALQFCDEFGIGWILFNLVIEGRCFDEHGIFYPDGTIRDAATIAAMFGCFRNRGSGSAITPPNPNREGAADRALKRIREQLDKNAKASTFADRDMNLDGLLEACERAANLLEACELVPMCDLPTATIEKYRRDPSPDTLEIRRFAFSLAEKLKEACQIVD